MMRQAITTKYLGPTNHRGSRIRATAQAGSVVVSWDDELDVNDNHLAAARTLAAKFSWPGRLIGGGLPSNRGNVYVVDDSDADSLKKILASDPATHHLNVPALAQRLHFRGVRATGV